MSSWFKECPSGRFAESGHMEPYNSFVKKLTSKPVVGVGWFTSPDIMAKQINDGILDFVGAARASIADPFLPNKLKEGREDDIRECIGAIYVLLVTTKAFLFVAHKTHPWERSGEGVGTQKR